MNNEKIFKELKNITENLGIKVILEKGNFKGGFCLLEKEKIVVINKLKPIEQRIKALVSICSKYDMTKVYLKPLLRKLIKEELI